MSSELLTGCRNIPRPNPVVALLLPLLDRRRRPSPTPKKLFKAPRDRSGFKADGEGPVEGVWGAGADGEDAALAVAVAFASVVFFFDKGDDDDDADLADGTDRVRLGGAAPAVGVVDDERAAARFNSDEDADGAVAGDAGDRLFGDDSGGGAVFGDDVVDFKPAGRMGGASSGWFKTASSPSKDLPPDHGSCAPSSCGVCASPSSAVLPCPTLAVVMVPF